MPRPFPLRTVSATGRLCIGPGAAPLSCSRRSRLSLPTLLFPSRSPLPEPPEPVMIPATDDAAGGPAASLPSYHLRLFSSVSSTSQQPEANPSLTLPRLSNACSLSVSRRFKLEGKSELRILDVEGKVIFGCSVKCPVLKLRKLLLWTVMRLVARPVGQGLSTRSGLGVNLCVRTPMNELEGVFHILSPP